MDGTDHNDLISAVHAEILAILIKRVKPLITFSKGSTAPDSL
jgi:hypothetical protein